VSVARSQPRGQTPTPYEQLLPILSALLSVLLVASVSAAVVLPRHQGEPFVGAASPAVVPAAPGDPGPPPVDDEIALAADAEAPTAPSAPGDQPDPAAAADLIEPSPEPPIDAVPVDPVPEAVDAPSPAPAELAAPAEEGEPEPRAYQEAPQAPAPPPPAASPAAPAEEGGGTATASGSGASESERIFAEEFPAQAAARQTDDPATQSWAVLVGVNRYQGRTADTLGSVADVMVLRESLIARGWREDHILVLTDVTATHDRIVRGIEWLIRSTDERSTVVFSFSGHMRHRDGVTALWPTDNRFIWAADLGRMLGAVPAGRLWASLQGCHAEGLRAPGLEGPNRIVTYSSRRAEKSYEDPEVGHSVQGFYLFAEGFRDGHGDLDGDGRISVQEAHAWAAPRAHTRTAQRQTPLIADGTGGTPFFLEVGSS
jgi:hypothetical protein